VQSAATANGLDVSVTGEGVSPMDAIWIFIATAIIAAVAIVLARQRRS